MATLTFHLAQVSTNTYRKKEVMAEPNGMNEQHRNNS